MNAQAVSLFAVAVVLVVSVSSWLEARRISAPMAFLALGAAAAVFLRDATADEPAIHTLTEVTLALILFHDAAQVRPAQLRRDAGLSGRLLLVGLPLTMLAGVLTASVLMPAATVWVALFLASALAPTDAGLGAPTVLNPVVPARVRRVLNVESGLNDGLSTPVVLLAIAAMVDPAATGEGLVVAALEELALGLAVGVAVGASVGSLLARTAERRLASAELVPIAVLVVPLLAYYGSSLVAGNGFVAAFASGTAFAAAHVRSEAVVGAAPSAGSAPDAGSASEVGSASEELTGDADPATALTASISTLLGYAVWAVFGLVAVPYLLDNLTWQAAVFAALSLTVLRMVPVALALAGTGLRSRTVLFIGWFGPRGLASVVFALLAVESVPDLEALSPVLAAVELTVVLSVVLHGATAGPWSRRYGEWAREVRPPVELELGSGEGPRAA